MLVTEIVVSYRDSCYRDSFYRDSFYRDDDDDVPDVVPGEAGPDPGGRDGGAGLRGKHDGGGLHRHCLPNQDLRHPLDLRPPQLLQDLYICSQQVGHNIAVTFQCDQSFTSQIDSSCGCHFPDDDGLLCRLLPQTW